MCFSVSASFSFSMLLLTLSTLLLLSTALSSLSLSLLLPPSPALSFIWGWCFPTDTAGCCLLKNCYGSRGFTIIPCSPKTVIHPSPRAHYCLTCASSSANTKLTAVYKELHGPCADKYMKQIKFYMWGWDGKYTPVITSICTYLGT